MKQTWGMKDGPEPKPAKQNEPSSIFKEPAFLEIVDNHIYFYSEIDRDKVLVLNKNLRALNNDILFQSKNNLLTY